MSAGPAPWLQRHWDLRAATNFAAGGAGAGLVVASVFAGAHGMAAAVALVAGLALVGTGLAAVWLEIGRPLRALNVFRNPRTSWMSREAYAGVALFVSASAAAWLSALDAPAASIAGLLAAAAALLFAICQGGILHAARGIPAWRSPATPALIVATALAEGAGAWVVIAAASGQAMRWALALLGAFVVARAFAWLAHRRTMAAHASAAGALASPGKTLLLAGTLAPLALAATAAAASAAPWATALAAAAGALAFVTGVRLKVALVVRGAFNQGFAIPHMPVRGARG